MPLATTGLASESLTAKAQWSASFSFTQRGHCGVLCLAIFFATCSGLVQPTVSIFMGRYSDALAQFGGGVIDSGTLRDRTMVGVHAFIVLGCCTLFTNAGLFVTWTMFGEMQAKSVREELFRSLLEKDLEWFEMRESGIASLLTRLQTQIRELQHGTSQPFGFVLQSLIEGLVAFAVAIYHGWKLALVILACLPLSAVFLYVIARGTQTHIESQHRCLAEASKVSNTAISNISLVKCFNTQAYETARYVIAAGEAATYSLKQSRIVAAQMGALGFLIFAMFMLGFWYGSKLVHDGGSTAGKTITTIWATFMSVQAFQNLVPHITLLAKGHAAAVALRELVDTVNRGRRSRRRIDGVSPETCDGEIEVCQASFAYPSRPEHLVMQGCTLRLHAGRTTFIVGKSGSGKSTLSSLLMRFYSPSSGAIFIDGHDIEDLDTSWLRNNITCVHQEAALFNETIRENIALGHRHHKHVTPAQICDCIRFAALEETIAEMPFGMETRVGVGGSALSGGQIQRVVIARAKLRDTPILVLDEATSALDHASRATVVKAIRQWREGLTTIIITHDLTQIGEEDFVYVLDGGRISNEGPRCRISHALLAMSTAKTESKTSIEIEATRGKPGVDNEKAARQRRRPPNLRWKKEGTTLRASFEEQLEHMDTGDYLRSPKGLFRASRLTTLFGNSTSERERSIYAAERQVHAGEPAGRPSSTRPSPSTAGTGRQVSQDIELRPVSLHPTLVARSAQQTSLNEEPLPSPRLLEKPSIQHRSRFGGSGFSKIEDVPSQMSLQAIYGTLLANLDRNHRIKLGLGFVAVCCRAALPAVFSFVLAKMFETFYQQANYRSKALRWTMVQFTVALIDGTTAFFGQYLLDDAARRWADRLRAEAMKRVLEQRMPWFEQDKNASSILTSILDRDAEEMRTLLSRFASLTVSVVVMMIVSIIWSFASCWKLTLVGLSTIPVIYGLARAFDLVATLWAARVNSAADSIGTVFMETFTDIQTVRSFTLEFYFHRKYNRTIKAAFSAGLARALYTGALFGLSESSVNFAVALLLWYSARLLASYDFAMTPVLISAFLLILSSGQASVIFGIIPQVAAAADSATRLIRLAQLHLRNEHEQGGKDTVGEHAANAEIAIKFRNVFFAYPSRPMAPVLRGLDLAIMSGQCVTMVGRSGSGKSTIASLLVSLYQVDAGPAEGASALAIFERDIRSLHLATLREAVVLVPQDPVIFSGTVWENICYGLEPHTRLTTSQNVNWAATQAAVHDFILSLPHQYDTVIGEGGLGVSGGQAQRIALARALVRRPKILILDEATSALDSKSADLIRSSLRSITRTAITGGQGEDMTIVVISHAREMMQFADQVIMLEHGRVVEEGPYEELMAKRGKLYDMLND